MRVIAIVQAIVAIALMFAMAEIVEFNRIESQVLLTHAIRIRELEEKLSLLTQSKDDFNKWISNDRL